MVAMIMFFVPVALDTKEHLTSTWGLHRKTNKSGFFFQACVCRLRGHLATAPLGACPDLAMVMRRGRFPLFVLMHRLLLNLQRGEGRASNNGKKEEEEEELRGEFIKITKATT